MFVIVVVIMIVISMLADAGILEVVAGRTVGEIERKSFEDGVVGAVLDLNNDRKIISLRKGSGREKCITIFGKHQTNGIGTVSGSDAYFLITNRDRL